MNQMTERKRLRREYLRRKAAAYMKGTAGAILIVPMSLYFCICVVVTLLDLYHLIVHGNTLLDSYHHLFVPGNDTLLAVAAAAGVTLVAGISTQKCWKARHEFRRAAQIAYVPPVTASTLPADEILVRGSEGPPGAQSEVLLRAAQAGQETPKEELLRVRKGP